jgi:hypothetical protein
MSQVDPGSGTTGRSVGSIWSVIGSASALVVVVCGALALAAFGSAHVLVHWLGAWFGLGNAWLHLERIAAESASTLSDYGMSIGQNLIFGAIVGIVLAIIRHKRILSDERLRWFLETVISPKGYSALRVGFCCLAFHISISLAIAFILAQLGLALPLPHFFGGAHRALLVLGNHYVQSVAGGGGGPPGGGVLDLLEYTIAIVLMLAVATGLVLTVSYWAAGLPAWKRVPWLGRATGGAVEEVSYGTAVQLGIVCFLVVSGKLGSAAPDWKSLTWSEKYNQVYYILDGEKNNDLWAMMFKGISNGAIHAIIYTVIVVIGSATYGLIGTS